MGMTREEAKSCIGTIEMLQRLAYNIHGVMDVIDADNCKKIIKALEQEPCEECVSRKAVIDTIYSECDGTKLDIDFAKVLLLQRAIKKMPAVVPIRSKGHWDIKDNMWWVCSACGCQTRMMKKYNVPIYCPACGAKMVGPQESEDEK